MASKEVSENLSTNDDYPLHMLRDKKTEMYVKFAKVMIIWQGPYTEKRKQFAQKIETVFKSSSRILSDETYKTEYRTECAAHTTEEFYAYLREEVKIALESGYNLIYIDTTISHVKQNEYYIAVANKMQYTVLIMPPVVTEDKKARSWPYGSQAHSFVHIQSYVDAPNMFQHLFCGWFLHDIDTEELRAECALYANDLFENIPDFGKWFRQGSKGGDQETFQKYFGLVKPDIKREEMVLREDLAFCPVKVFGTQYTMQEYFKKPMVREQYGRMSKLHVVGFVITPHMVAARVKLNHRQKELWEMNDKISENAYVETEFPFELYKSVRGLPPPVPDVRRICSKSNNTITKAESVFDPTQLIAPYGKGRSAHIVLGMAPGASPADIDFGVAFGLNRELTASKSQDSAPIEVIDIGKSLVKRIGKYWFIYMKETIFVNGFFSSCVKPNVFDTPLQTSKKL